MPDALAPAGPLAGAQALLAKVERFLVPSPAERRAILDLPVRIERVRADQSILREGDRPVRSCLLLEGLACNSKVGPNGKRQILAFYLPEDMPDLTSLLLDARDSDIWALTGCALAFMDHRDLGRLCDDHPRLARFLWRATLVEASIHHEWTMNVGLRDALERTAHLFCELTTRLAFTGRADATGCALPLTQGDLAEATGVSDVHANRVLQELRGRGLLDFGRGRLLIHDWDGLAALSDFRTDYLHLPPADPVRAA